MNPISLFKQTLRPLIPKFVRNYTDKYYISIVIKSQTISSKSLKLQIMIYYWKKYVKTTNTYKKLTFYKKLPSIMHKQGYQKFNITNTTNRSN